MFSIVNPLQVVELLHSSTTECVPGFSRSEMEASYQQGSETQDRSPGS